MQENTGRKHPVTLTIASSDSCGGAGIQADLKTFSALGTYGATVIVALTAQNTTGVKSIHPVPASIVADQMEMIRTDIPPDAIKIGMLFNAELIHTVSRELIKFDKQIPVVIDPVMVSQNGDRLLEEDAISALKNELFPMATLITPNIYEAEVILNRKAEVDDPMEDMIKELAKSGTASVLLKGGHSKEKEAVDYLFYKKKNKVYRLSHERINTPNTHGTGCTLSSAIAAYLSLGKTMVEAVEEAKSYTNGAIKAGSYYETGKGSGPLHHFFRIW